MIKSLGLAALTLSLPFIPAALGCSSSSTGGEVNPGDDASTTHYDSGTGSETSTGNHDSGQTFDGSSSDSSTGDGGGGTCPASVSGYTGTTYNAPMKMPGVCDASEIMAFINVCGDNYSQTDCQNWFQETDAGGGDACGACITGTASNAGTPNNDGAIYFDVTGMNFGPNYGACIALTDTTNGTACATAYNDVTDCIGTACDQCSDNTSYGDCDMSVEGATGECASFDNAAQTACANDEGDAGAITVCSPGAATNTQDPDWTYIINLVCGTGAH
jgi:hypothetical protein